MSELTVEEAQEQAYAAFARAAAAGVTPPWEVWNSWGETTQDTWIVARNDVENARMGVLANMIRYESAAEEGALPMMDEDTQDAVMRERLRRETTAARFVGGLKGNE